VKSILRATAILSSSSIVSIVIGLFSAKAYALFLGSNGLGMLGLQQSLVNLTSLLTGMGIGVGVVRLGANALSHGDEAQIAALRRAAWILCWGLGGFAVCVMVVFRWWISEAMLGSSSYANYVVLMGAALLFTLASGIFTSILNAYHRISELAKIGVFNSVIASVISIGLIWRWGEHGIAAAIIGSAAVSSLTAWWFARSVNQPNIPRPSYARVLKAMRALLGFAGPYTASMAVGTGVQYVLPALVLHVLDIDSVGYYRAALAISVTYLGFLLTAMGQDYYPRIAAVADQPLELNQIVNQQYHLVLVLALPMITVTLALAPYLVPLIYSPQFLPTVDVLQWYLIGDLFKFGSWTFGTVILARSSTRTLFLIELIAGANTIIMSYFGIRWFGLAGLGIGFLITYIAHFLITWAIVRKETAFVLTPSNVRRTLVAIGLLLASQALTLPGLADIRTPLLFGAALLVGFESLYTLWRDVGGWQYVRFWRSSRNVPS
jgi:PST family polysaccharide transporter